MGHARHIGRVGPLAVALGVGIAIATTPATAYASPSSSTSSDASASKDAGAATGTSSTSASGVGGTDGAADGGTGAQGANGADGADGAAGETAPDGQIGDDDAAGDIASETDSEVAADEDAVGESHGDVKQGGDHVDLNPTNGGGRDVQSGDESLGAQAVTGSDDSDAADAFGLDVHDDDRASQRSPAARSVGSNEVNDAPAAFSLVDTGRATTTLSTDTVPQRATLVSVVTDFVSAVLNPFLGTGGDAPIGFPILTAMLAAVRDEMQRIFLPRNSAPAQNVVALVSDSGPQTLDIDPTQQHVLVIGVDGTNMSRILESDENENFFALMDESTNAVPSIVGHTTVSNPSWTAILTGVWGERTGVINNIFTPGTYDKWPTVFDQLESQNPDIDTMAIADWDVIGGIAQAGAHGADVVKFVPQIEGDTNWLDTDDEVGDATVAAINSTDAPNFLFSYFVGVDENGHMYGGASPQYEEAINNVDDNLGHIMTAIDDWESTHAGEKWTVIVVTDHGHQPQKGFGHGFQSPPETATFVIAHGPDFAQGNVNPDYSIVDTTPTVMNLFGYAPRSGSDGVSLLTLGDGEHPADLHAALESEIAAIQPPDALTNLALSARTIFAFVPYYVYTFSNQAAAGLPSFLQAPVGLLFDGLYVATNVPAQIVALATGVSGASIFPLFPPAPPTFPPTDVMNVDLLSCDGATPSASCAADSVA